ncbi:signal peptidase I [Oryzihumus sp.]|uniref:signal peptidase I n=1 Tax=Oryzihumus sp. TaxID=1968903 RepID=UPI002ED7D4A4
MNPGPPTAPAETTPTPAAREVAPRHATRLRWLVVVVVALLVTLVVRGFLVQSFYVPSASMQPTLQPGDRIMVTRVGVVHRGDIVVFDGSTTFAAGGSTAPAPTGLVTKVVSGVASLLSVQTHESDYVKRVVGVAGDHVVCCDAQGALRVNGVAVHEPYLYPGDKPSDLTFDVTVPAGHIWVMGDHRSDSADSRAHLGDPGGGMVRLDDVIGRAALVYWPLGRTATLSSPGGLADIPAAQGQR